MNNPLVSACVTTYNQASFIRKTIEGVLQQKLNSPYELVIGEDCSQDGTRGIVLEYQRKYPDMIRVIVSDSNVGPAQNSYRVVKACKGKYLAFCDGDDYWHRPDKLQKQLDYMEDHGDCGLTYSSFDIYHAGTHTRIEDYLNKAISCHNWHRPGTPAIIDFLSGRPYIGYGILTCTVMARRLICNQIVDADHFLYLSGCFGRWDTQLWAEIAHVSRVHYIPESFATYNLTNESATRSKDIRKLLRMQISDADLALYLCNKYNLPTSTKARIYQLRCDRILRLAFHTGDAHLADEVRSGKTTFTPKDWLMYHGARHAVLRHFLSPVLLVRSAFRNPLDRYRLDLRRHHLCSS